MTDINISLEHYITQLEQVFQENNIPFTPENLGVFLKHQGHYELRNVLLSVVKPILNQIINTIKQDFIK